MNGWTFLYIYLAGSTLVALRLGWDMLFRLDKYDWRYSMVWMTFWFDVIFWPLLMMLKPRHLISPNFAADVWVKGQVEEARELDRLALNLPPCSAAIRFAPDRDEWGACHGEFVFDAAEVETVMATRLSDLPVMQHGGYDAILNWLRQRDHSQTGPTDVPPAWNSHFLNVAVGMMNRELGLVRCRECGEIIPREQVSIGSTPNAWKTSGWSFNLWVCPQNHKLLTKDAMHFYIRNAD